jgi:hypothetical protein
LSTIALQSTRRFEVSAAPTRPPINACEDEDGRPKRQVMMFQLIAPNSAASTTTRPCVPSGGLITEPTVSATPCPRKAPMKFMTAASSRATRAVKARVDTEVAMAFAAS